MIIGMNGRMEKVDRTCTFQQWPDWTSISCCFCTKWQLQGIRFRLEGEQLGENYLGLGVGRWKASWGSSSLILQPLLSCRQLQREITWLSEVTGSLTGHLAVKTQRDYRQPLESLLYRLLLSGSGDSVIQCETLYCAFILLMSIY